MKDQTLSLNEPIYSPLPGEAQFTFGAIFVGCLTGCVVSAINVYFGLKMGMSFSGALTAAILGFAIFKLLRKRYTVLQNVITETVGSAASGVVGALGITSTLPALQMLGKNVTMVEMYLWCLSVAFLGVFFAIPLRHKLIIVDELRFPTGIAAAESIRTLHSSAGEGLRRARWLLVMSLVAGAYMLCGNWFPALRQANVFDFFGLGAVTALGFVLYFSPALLGSGMLIGLRIGASALAGAIIAWGILTPLLQHFAVITSLRDPHRGAMTWLVWPAITLIVAESIMSIVLDLPSSWGRRGGKRATHQSPAKASPAAISRKGWICGVSALSILNIAVMHYLFQIPVLLTAAAIALTFFMSLVTARVLGETDIGAGPFLGKLNQVVFASLSPGQPISNLMTGSITTGIATAASDLLQDWKTGFLLGASPRKQFLAQLIGLATGVITAIPIYLLFTSVEVVGSEELPAPIAILYKNISEVLAQGLASLPPYTGYAILCAAIIGIFLPILAKFTKSGASWLPNLAGVGIGFVLPPSYSVTLFIGACVGSAWAKRQPGSTEYILITASGLIVGESFVEIGGAIYNLLFAN